MTSSSQPLFDVERFRGADTRVASAPEVRHATLVLGSTQSAELPDPEAVRARDVEVVRRRGGGGAVYLEPGDHLWMDAWIPRGDPLWTADVSAAAEWVGAWWLDALDALHSLEALVVGPGAGTQAASAAAYSVHRGRSVPGELGDLVCFAGRGPGEVYVGERKLVGLSQWRSREGALFSSCAYVRWQPLPMVDLLDVGEPNRGALAEELKAVAIGLADVDPAMDDTGPLLDVLLASFPSFSFHPSDPGGTVQPG